jgi:hypothetical protein
MVFIKIKKETKQQQQKNSYYGQKICFLQQEIRKKQLKTNLIYS